MRVWVPLFFLFIAGGFPLHATSPAWPLPPLVSGEWREVDSREVAEWRRRMQGAVPKDWQEAMTEVSRVRITNLEFYPGARLVEALIDVVDARPWGIAFVVPKPGVMVVLDGTAAPIHELNKTVPVRLRTEQQVWDYLKFFNSQIHIERENLRIVESLEDLFHQQEISDEVKTQMQPHFTRPTWKRLEDGGWEIYPVLFDLQGHLIKNRYRVEDDGNVQMLEEGTGLARLPLRVERFMGLARTARLQGESVQPREKVLNRMLRNRFSEGRPPQEQIQRSNEILQQPGVNEPQRLQAMLLRAEARFLMNDYAGALEEFNALLALAPNHVEGLLGRARTLFMLDRHEETFRDFDKIQQLNPGDSEAHARRAGALQILGRHEEAIAEAHRGAEGGHRDAMTVLGLGYLHKEEPEQAVVWLRKAAAAGSTISMQVLGYCYDLGQGVEADPVTAVSWYRRAALRGDISAQMNLANLLFNGQKVTGNPGEAYAWYETAARQGLANGQYMVGLCWNEGYGVRKNPEKAKPWFALAAAQGHEKAIEIVMGKVAPVKTNHLREELFQAVKNEDVHEVKRLLELGADPNAQRGVLRETPLHLAAYSNKGTDVIKLLLEYGADVNAKWFSGTPLTSAAYNRNVEIVRILLDAGARINDSGPLRHTALWGAAANSNIEVAKELLKRGADHKVKSAIQETPLIYAVQKNSNFDVIKLFLELEEDVNAKFRDGMTLLMHAAKSNDNVDVIKELVRYGIDLNARDNSGKTALSHAIEGNRNVHVIRALLKAGAKAGAEDSSGNRLLQAVKHNPAGDMTKEFLTSDVEIEAPVDSEGNTLLMLAAKHNYGEEVVKVLIQAGANVNAKNHNGETPLLLASVYSSSMNHKNSGVIRELLQAGADPNARDREGRSPMIRAAEKTTNPEVIAELLKGGADIHATDADGRNPLFIAIRFSSGLFETDNKGVVSELIKSGLDPNAKNAEGFTPLMLAAGRTTQSSYIIKELLEGGADPNVGRDDDDGLTPLMYAALMNISSTVMEALIEAGADPNVRISSGATPLIAVFHNKNRTVIENFTRILLKAGADPNIGGSDDTPLMLAAERNHKVVADLIRAGADPNAKSRDGSTALMAAAESNSNPAVITVLLRAGADFREKDVNGKTALDRAVAKGNLPAIQELNKAGIPPLMLAARHNVSPEEVMALLISGVDPYAKNDKGETALIWAARYNKNPEVVRVLLNAGAAAVREKHKPRAADIRRPGWSPFQFHSAPDAGEALRTAIAHDRPASIIAVLSKGVGPNWQDGSGFTPLMAAVAKPDNLEIITLLLKDRPNLNLKSQRTGYTALMGAAKYNRNPEVFAALLNAGADIRIRDNEGRSALDYARDAGNSVAITALVKAGTR